MRAVRETIELHRGDVALEDDGSLLASFDGPSRALQCAHTLRARCAANRIDLHCGLHTSEIERAQGEITGVAVDVARELMTAAKSGEVIATAVLRDLAAGTGLGFTEHAHRLAEKATPCFRLD
jgi:class 3 adenylate cyclase